MPRRWPAINRNATTKANSTITITAKSEQHFPIVEPLARQRRREAHCAVPRGPLTRLTPRGQMAIQLAISPLLAGPHQTSDSAAPVSKTTAAAQNGTAGATVNNEPAPMEPSACPRLPEAAC